MFILLPLTLETSTRKERCSGDSKNMLAAVIEYFRWFRNPQQRAHVDKPALRPQFPLSEVYVEGFHK